MERRVEPVVIDAERIDGTVATYKISSEKTSIGPFAYATFAYGLKIVANFTAWVLKNMVLLIGETLKAAAEGNREMNAELRRNRPRYVGESKPVVEPKTLHYHDNRSFFYIPSKEEERAAKLALRGK
jgi:hypothetical protein